MHGLGNFIQNAIQFARREVSVTTHWDRGMVTIEVVDDGPGFPAALLPRLGQPYLSGRGGEAQQHMGLGIFIAQTLLERTGAEIGFANLPEGGAHIVITWRRTQIETRDERHPRRELAI
jgi:two-component system sensor histidine kinase RegB